MNITYVFLLLMVIVVFIQRIIEKNDKNSIFGKDNSSLTRVIATYCIIYGHTVDAIHGTTIFDKINLGWCWVAVFFFWSGYGVLYSYHHKKNYLNGFLYNRGVKILVPFLFVHIIYFAVKSMFGIKFSIVDILQGLIGGLNIVEFSWYPIAAIIMYFLFYFSWKLPVKEHIKFFVLTLLVVALTGIEYAAIGLHGYWWMISNLAFPMGLLFYNLKKYENKLIFLISGIIFLIVGMAINPISNVIFEYVPDVLYIISCNIQTSSLALAMISSISVFSALGNKKIIINLNKISYEMYLCHGLVIFVLTKLINNGYCVLLITLLITPVLAIPIHYIDEMIVKRMLKFQKTSND